MSTMTDTAIPTCNNTSVGIIVVRDQRLLLLERKKFPVGFACPAGHLEPGESYEDAARRELKEETGLVASSLKKVIAGKRYNRCRRHGGLWHYWRVYTAEVDASQELGRSVDEAKQLRFYSPKDIKPLVAGTELYLEQCLSQETWEKRPGLEPVWYFFLKYLDLLPK